MEGKGAKAEHTLVPTIGHEGQPEEWYNPHTAGSQQLTEQTAAQTPAVRKDSTGVTFGGTGQVMDIDKARTLGLCFKCGQRGHIGRFSPNKGTARVQQLEEVAAAGPSEATKPVDPNELILRQLSAFGEMFEGFSDRLSKMETQGFGSPQQ